MLLHRRAALACGPEAGFGTSSSWSSSSGAGIISGSGDDFGLHAACALVSRSPPPPCKCLVGHSF